MNSLPTDPFFRKSAELRAHVEPLRSGTPLLTESQLEEIDKEVSRWYAEWTRRRKVFREYAIIIFALYAISPTHSLSLIS
jgi:hypothetical protein